jgi:hypothetical protein
MRNQIVRLGSLGLMECFKIPGEKTVYRTITYAPSVCETRGHRWVLNLTTNTARWFYCTEKVSTWNVVIEISRINENE